MREIKFRYWNKTNNIMVFEPSIRSDYQFSLNEYLGDDRGWVWMQYTGLKDKNGKEIYEGDVLCEVEDDLEGGQEGTFMEVYFDTFGCWQLRGNSMVNGEMLYDHYKYAEIIGNIYENPDLLTNTN